MAHLAVRRTLHEGDLHHNLRPDPKAFAGKVCSNRKRWLRQQQRVKAAAQVREQLAVEAGTDTARVNEIVAVVVADEERTEADA